MRRNNKLVALIAAISISSLIPLHVIAEPIKLEEGAPVRLKLLDTISSGSNHQGDSVSFRVIDDVLSTDEKTVLIKAGTPAWGSISNLEERGHLGEKGQLSLAIEGTKSVDGKRIPLRAALNRDGKGKLGTAIALSFIITPLFLFMRGKDATIAAGTQVNTYVDRDVHVDVTPASTKSAVHGEPAALSVSSAVITPPTECAVSSANVQVNLSNSEEGPDASAALDKLYESGLLTKKEYATKRKALAKKSIALKK